MSNEKIMSFETIKLPSEFYITIIKMSIIFTAIGIIALIIFNFIYKKYKNNAASIPFLWYCYMPKAVVCGMAIFLVFFFDYEKKKPTFFNCDDMLMTTFLVGVLAIIEILSIITACIRDVCESKKLN